MPDAQCANDLVVAIVGALVVLTTLGNMAISYYRHQHIMSDNKRLLHVIEAKTASVGDVK